METPFALGARVMRCGSPPAGSLVKDGAVGTVLERLPEEDGAAAYGYMVRFTAGAPPVFCAGSRLVPVDEAAPPEAREARAAAVSD